MSIQEKYSKFIKEILFIVTLSVALFLLFCLVSYSKGLLALPAVYQEPVDNWCGVIGHYLARYSLSFLGMASFCPIIILVYSSISFLRKNETLDRLPFLVAGITGTTISIATLLAVMEVNIFLDGTILPGGYVGFLLNNILIGFIGTAGSILLCFTLLLFSLMAAVRFSPYEFTLWVTQFFSSLVIYIHRKTGALCRDCFEIVKEKAGSPPLLSGAVRGRQLGRNVRFIDVPLENEKVVYDEPEVPIYTNIETQSVGVNLETTSDQVIHQSYETRDVETENQEDEQEEVEIQTVGSEIEEEKTKPLIYHTFEQEYHENDIENDREDNIIPVINQAPERQPEESIKKPEIAPEVVQVAKSKEEPVSEQPQQPVIHRQPSTGEEVAPAQESLSQQRVPASQQQTPEVQEQASVVQQQGSVSPHQPSVPSQQVPAVHEAVKVEKVSTSQGNDEERTFSSGQFVLPPISLLDPHKDSAGVDIDKEHFFKISKILERKLLDFNVKGNVVGISPGPVVTTYEYSPAPGVKINKIMSLADDLAMVLKVERVRVMGSIPGKAAVGIEIPNPVRKTVFLREILESQAYSNSESRLSLAMGLDSVGQAVIADLTKMPHLLIAGATGAGKSVAINAFIASMLYKSTPEEVRLLMIDPKRIELSVYEDIPHLLHPVVVEPKMASRALMWAVKEMERRYKLLGEKRVKSFVTYNMVAEEKLPYIVIIVDELADLMMVASKDVETSIARLAQMARAAGMHIMLATQRPSVDVLTGLIKANFPTRISFKVSSKVDSRTILDTSGAEHLLGAGDMLFVPPGAAKLQRIHGAYIDESETERIITFLKEQGKAQYDESVMQVVEEEVSENGDGPEEYDEKYDEAVSVVCDTGQASISMVQRRLRVGYNRAARMIELMEKEGIVGPADGSKAREVLARPNYDEPV